jgi:hypothetical protein
MKPTDNWVTPPFTNFTNLTTQVDLLWLSRRTHPQFSWSCHGTLVKGLSSYIRDIKHACYPNLSEYSFSWQSPIRLLHGCQILITVIPHRDRLRVLKFFLDKGPNQEPSTAVLARLAKLETSVPFLVATIAAKDTKCVSFPNLALSTLMALKWTFSYV